MINAMTWEIWLGLLLLMALVIPVIVRPVARVSRPIPSLCSLPSVGRRWRIGGADWFGSHKAAAALPAASRWAALDHPTAHPTP